MSAAGWAAAAIAAPTVAAGAIVARAARRRGLDRWIGPYLLSSLRRRARPEGPIAVLICIADHYEPKFGGAAPASARERVEAWVRDYPRLFSGFRDSDGRPPRHSFFYPIEEYEPEYLDALAGLCRDGFGEVEVHLHHDGDTSGNLRRTLDEYRHLLADRHRLLSRDPATGEPVYAFIHGNWALDNSRPDGRWCGVNDELDILRETGCYADFTMPSYPSETQTRTINSLYYAVDDPRRPKSHDRGVAVGSGPRPERSLMLLQGPLALDWGRRKWGLIPRIENGCIQANQPPSVDRLGAWLAAGVRVPTRPDWYFVKLHTHGAPEGNRRVLLGDATARFHEGLARRAEADANFRYHYVTAREMYNLALAAEAGWAGAAEAARDFRLPPPPN